MCVYARCDAATKLGMTRLMIRRDCIQRAHLNKVADAVRGLAASSNRLASLDPDVLNTAYEAQLPQRTEWCNIIAEHMWTHAFPPVGLGPRKGQSDLPHKLKAMLHSMFLETGDQQCLHTLLDSIVSMTTDFGTEFLIASVPFVSVTEVIPYIAFVSIDGDGQNMCGETFEHNTDHDDVAHPDGAAHADEQAVSGQSEMQDDTVFDEVCIESN